MRLGFLHGDLKPCNVLVAGGECPPEACSVQDTLGEGLEKNCCHLLSRGALLGAFATGVWLISCMLLWWKEGAIMLTHFLLNSYAELCKQLRSHTT